MPFPDAVCINPPCRSSMLSAPARNARNARFFSLLFYFLYFIYFFIYNIKKAGISGRRLIFPYISTGFGCQVFCSAWHFRRENLQILFLRFFREPKNVVSAVFYTLLHLLRRDLQVGDRLAPCRPRTPFPAAVRINRPCRSSAARGGRSGGFFQLLFSIFISYLFYIFLP